MDYFVVIVKEGHEEFITEDMAEEAYVAKIRFFWQEEFRRVRHRKTRALVETRSPLWPGYVFVQFHDERRMWDLRSIDGVLGIVGVAGYPARMREWQFDRMERELNGQSNAVERLPEIVGGDTVEIRAGQFTGHQGIFRNENVELLMFGKRVKLKIDPEFLRKVS